MGIHKLMEIIKVKAGGCISNHEIDFYSGMKVACDASIVKCLSFLFSYSRYDTKGDVLIPG